MSYTGMMELIHALKVVTAGAVVWLCSFVEEIPFFFFAVDFLGIRR